MNPDCIELCLFNGHNALTLGSHRHALAEYFFLLERGDCPSEVVPLITLCIAVAYLQIALQKTCGEWLKLNIIAKCSIFGVSG